ncbi:hypothetical protein ACFV1L_26955 [Kitasatospora sp. NPDC059646]
MHAFRLDDERAARLPHAVHGGPLRTDLPFPVETDLKQLVEL